MPHIHTYPHTHIERAGKSFPSFNYKYEIQFLIFYIILSPEIASNKCLIWALLIKTYFMTPKVITVHIYFLCQSEIFYLKSVSMFPVALSICGKHRTTIKSQVRHKCMCCRRQSCTTAVRVECCSPFHVFVSRDVCWFTYHTKVTRFDTIFPLTCA